MKLENPNTQDSNMTKKAWVEPTLEVISEVIAGNLNATYDENVTTAFRGTAS